VSFHTASAQRRRSTHSKVSEDLLQGGSNRRRYFAEKKVFHCLHRGDRIDGGDIDLAENAKAMRRECRFGATASGNDASIVLAK